MNLGYKLVSKIALSIGLVVFTISSAHAYLPIYKHLSDATKINRERAPKYAELSNNKSLKLSYELIAMERVGILGTIKLDYEAKAYLKHDIGVFHDDLIDMALTPKFSSHYLDNLAPREQIIYKTKPIIKKWKESIKQYDLQAIYDEAVVLLEVGELKETNQNCLTRHFVESIARSILNHEGHRTKALSLGLKDPKEMLLEFLKIQVNSLIWTESLDKRAFKIQKENIPLFCNDVPAIPYH